MMNKMAAILLSLNLVLWGAAIEVSASAEQSPIVAGMMRDVTELGDIIQKKHAIIDASAGTNVTKAIIKAVDPYAEILTKEKASLRAEELRGVFYGLGISLAVKNKTPAIAEVLKGGPAETASLKAGNIIEKIDDQKTEGLPLENIVSKLRGAKDEPVKLTILSGEKNAETNEYTLKRTLVQMPVTGLTEEWPYQIYYLKANGLYENSGVEISTQLTAWAEAKCSGIILDLRNADGEDLQTAADVAGLFLPENAPIINAKDGNGTVTAAYQGKVNKTITAPVMVLINRGTTGAAEALAAALESCKGILLIGAPTRGDDAIREFIPLSDGRIVYLATRKIEIINGTSYHGNGVKPHVAVEQKKEPQVNDSAGEDDNGPAINLPEEERLNRALLRRTKGDPVLQRATDILLGLKALNIKGR